MSRELPADYVRRSRAATGVLLAIWFIVTYVVAFSARSLSFEFFGWPFSFWMGAQGAPGVYLLITLYYARYMNKIDREFGITDQAE